MLPWPILVGGVAVLAWIVFSPAGPAGPAQAAPSSPPAPTPPQLGSPSSQPGQGNDDVPPFVSGF